MLWNSKGIRRALGAPLTAFALSSGVVSPLLDSGHLRADAVLASGERPSATAGSHDHTLCTQLGSSQALASIPGVRVLATGAGVAAPPALPPSVTLSVPVDGHPTRAPPSA